MPSHALVSQGEQMITRLMIFSLTGLGMRFEDCRVGFGKKMNWEMGLISPFRTLIEDIFSMYEKKKLSNQLYAFSERSCKSGKWHIKPQHDTVQQFLQFQGVTESRQTYEF